MLLCRGTALGLPPGAGVPPDMKSGWYGFRALYTVSSDPVPERPDTQEERTE